MIESPSAHIQTTPRSLLSAPVIQHTQWEGRPLHATVRGRNNIRVLDGYGWGREGSPRLFPPPPYPLESSGYRKKKRGGGKACH